MNPLRNPVVVGVLAVAAVGVVIYQTVWAGRVRPRLPDKKLEIGSAKPQPPAAPAPAAAKPGFATTIPAPVYTNVDAALMPAQAMESATIERLFKTWVSAPLRDPFLLLQPVVASSATALADTNSPVPTWTLAAIWNQTGSRLAVINTGTTNQAQRGVYQAGDVIVENYKLLRIERDEVWIQGPHANERLGFPVRTKAPEPSGAAGGPPRGQAQPPPARPAFAPTAPAQT